MLLILGISLAHLFSGVSIKVISFLLAITLGTSLYLYRIASNKFQQTIYFGATIFLATLLIGWFTYLVHQDTLYPSHYTHHTTSQPQKLSIEITETLKPSDYYYKYIGTITHINGQSTTGKVIVKQPKDSTQSNLLGLRLFCYTEIKKIPPPLNPYEFNYASYMQHQQVYGQCNLTSQNYYITDTLPTNLTLLATRLRSKIINNLKKARLSGDELEVTKALFLGQRQNISEDLYKDYIHAGVIHLLAISGLHISILVMLLYYVLLPLRNTTTAIWISGALMVILLWCFAFITGLSPSVTRAVTMFTFVTIALHLKRPQNSVHTLMASAFFLLLIKPNMLFMASFQLSYIAVLGILTIQPLLAHLWRPSNSIILYFWNMTTVMLAAQLALLPISLYYFHQYPLLFFIGNLCIVPFMGILLGYGFLVILLAALGITSPILVKGLSYCIYSMNTLVNNIATVKNGTLENIYFDNNLLILTYCLLFITILAFTYKHKKLLYSSLCLVLALQGYLYYLNYYSKQQQQLIVFNTYGSHTVGIQNEQTLNLYTTTILENSHYLLKQYKAGAYINTVKQNPLQHYYQYKNQHILVVDSAAVYQLNHKPIDIVILTQSPKLNMARLLTTIQPNTIIADANNYPYLLKRWQKECELRHITFHNTNTQGAYVIN